MTRIESIIALLKANTGATTVAPSLIASYANLAETTTLETISSTIMAGSILKPGFEIAPAADVIEQMFISLFGYSQTEMDELRATEAGAAGFQYWVDELNNNVDIINVNTLAIALLNGAAEADQAKAAALVADELAAYEDYVTDNPVEPEEKEGQTIYLTSGTDRGDIDAKFNGTDDADTFNAYIDQNPFAGGVSNSLSSADHLDGGAGTDTLYAELVQEFVGVTAMDNNDIKPNTTDIEIVEFNNIDDDTTVTIDAKNMNGVEKIGSVQSDGDLVIENLTTLKDDGESARNTSDMTITMDHTDNFNSDSDASDLTVYFDEDYLLTGETTKGATLTIRLINAVQNEAGNNPVDGFSEIKFKVGDAEVVVDITSVANDASQDFTTAYAAIVDLINDELKELGFTDVTASAPALEDAVFSIPVAGFTTGDDAGDYYPIIVKNEGKEPLTGVNIATSALQYDTDLNNSFSTVAPETNNDPVSVNVELHKVGREGEGGDLIIGGKELDKNTPDTTEGNGIHTFNISVLGNESKLSNVGTILSTNGALRVVNIASEARTDNNYASLTVREGFGGTLETLNANNFKGDLLIGTDEAAQNIDTFTATGGGDVTLVEDIFAGEALGNAATFASLDSNTYTITTAGGSDNITVQAEDGAQVTITTGAGNDTINADIIGADDSGSTPTKVFITSTSGNNVVSVDELGTVDDNADGTSSVTAELYGYEAAITLGSGDDIVNGGDLDITVDTGAGSDTIYASNEAQKAVFSYVKGTAATALGAQAVNGDKTQNIDETELLYGRTVTVTLATQGLVDAAALDTGFESAAIAIKASNGYLTTELDLYTAIAKAINDDDVLSKLASASIDSNGDLTISYLVDGAVVNGDVGISYEISNTQFNDAVAADLSASEQAGLLADIQEKYADSGITAGTVETAYEAVGTLTQSISVTTTDGIESADTDVNILNGGLGDDVIVLNSNTTTDDTVVIDAGGFGNDTIVHFNSAQNGDILDFTDFLNGQSSISGSPVSRTDIANTLNGDATVEADSVTILTFTAAGTDTWAGLNATTLKAAINSTNTGTDDYANIDETTLDALTTYTASGPGTDLVGGTGHAIVMIENAANDGEYKVFELTFNGTATNTNADFTNVTLVGTLDFGDTLDATFDATNLA